MTTVRLRVVGWIAVLALIAACASPAAPVETFVPIVPDPTLEPFGGSGIVTFGDGVDPDTLQIVKPRTSFKASSKAISWSASLTESAGATSLTLIIASRTSAGVERTIVNDTMDVSNPDSDTFANTVDLALVVDRKPGVYVMRILRDSDVLAEGSFKLVK